MSMSQVLLATTILLGASSSFAGTWTSVFGEFNGATISTTEIQGTVFAVMTTGAPSDSTKVYTGAVKGVFSEPVTPSLSAYGLPSSVAYTVKWDGDLGWLKMTGIPSMVDFSVIDNCSFTTKIDATVTDGRMRVTTGGQSYVIDTTMSFLTFRGVSNICTGAELWYVVDGLIALIVN